MQAIQYKRRVIILEWWIKDSEIALHKAVYEGKHISIHHSQDGTPSNILSLDCHGWI